MGITDIGGLDIVMLIIDLGVTSLRGRTNYGDSIEDEWVVVYLLRELTKKHNDIWVRVVDSDGEFLLVEAAGVLPAWVEPDIAENRVRIYSPPVFDHANEVIRYGYTKEN